MSFVKLDESIRTSSLNDLPVAARWLWVILLTMCDKNGEFHGTISAISRIANLGIDETREALERFQEPDPDSTTPTDDGRRLELVSPNRWRVVNYVAYARARNAEERREYDRERKRRAREDEMSADVRTCPQVSADVRTCPQMSADVRTLSADVRNRPHVSALSAHTDTDTDTDTDRRHSLVEDDEARETKTRDTGPPFDPLGEWNAVARETGLPTIRTITKPRSAALRARAREHGWDAVLEVLRWPTRSEFLSGASGWAASFDWLLRPTNFVKVLEGNYADRARASPSRAEQAVGQTPQRVPWNVEDVRRYNEDPRWDAYLDDHEGLPGPWPRFDEWSQREEGRDDDC